jgi:hypothetical protein
MSEYQYYEFQAIDRPLTPQEQQAVARLSSRVAPHPRRAVFSYSFGGSLRRRPQDLLVDYYDAMLYLANWGSRQLLFRFPTNLIDVNRMQQYSIVMREYPVAAIDVSVRGDSTVLDIHLDEESGLGWLEGEGWLDALVGLRDAILRQDYRLLYLAWLTSLTLAHEVDGEALEPPVPPGLQTLSPALESFIELFGLDEDLIHVAAELSGPPDEAIPDGDLRRAITQLTAQERDAFLLRLARGEPHLSVALNRRLGVLGGVLQDTTPERRTVSALFAAVEALRDRRRREAAVAAEARRMEELEAFAGREDETWHEVDVLIQRSQAKAYDEAVRLLTKLRGLADYQKRRPAFAECLDQIRDRYSRRHALMRRLREAGLIAPKEKAL